MTIIYATEARVQLNEIWEWNEERYSAAHAQKYIEFLQQQIDGLRNDPQQGKAVKSRPGLRYILLRRKFRGHCHVAVYRVRDKQINVLHVFHSAQN